MVVARLCEKIFILLLVIFFIFPVTPENDVHSTVKRYYQQNDIGSRDDNEAPSMFNDSTPLHAKTGGELTFSANFTDNVDVKAVRVNYSHDNIPFENISMNNVAGDWWNTAVNIDVNATEIIYYFFFNDSNGNENVSSPKTITIIDIVPPVANAGPDMFVPQSENFYLNGSNSTDNIGVNYYTWFWHCFCGEENWAYGPVPLISGDPDNLTVYLNVTDAEGNWAVDSVYITMIDVIPPVAIAGEDVVVVQHETVFFNGSRSVDNYGVVNYTWSFFYNNTKEYLYGKFANFTFDIADEYLVELVVGDAAGNNGIRSMDNFSISVSDITLPVAFAGNDAVIEQHQLVTFNGSLSHDNVMITDYTWNFTYGGRMKLFSGATLKFTFDEAVIYIITLNVTDEAGNWDLDSMQLTVKDITDPIANPGADFWTENIGDSINFDASYSSDNLGIVNYTWSFNYNDTFHQLYGVEATFKFYVVQIIDVTLTVTDAAGNWNNSICSVNIVDTTPPAALAGPDMIVGAGTNVTLNANGTWDHSQILSYVWIFTYDGVGRTLSGMDVDFRFDLIGTYPVLLIVRDIWENAATDTLIVEVKDLSPPLIEAGNDMNLTAGEPAFLNGSAWDNVGITEYTWRFKYNESEVVLEGNTVLFEFKIPGNYIVSLFVQDEAGNIANDTIIVNVAKSSVIDINDTVDDDDPDDDDLDDDSDDNDDIDDDNGDGIPQDTDEEKGSGILWFWILAILVMLMFITMCLFVVIMKHRSREKSVPPITSNNDEMNPKQMKLDLPEDETTDKLSSDEGEKIVPVSKKIDTLPTEEF